MHHFIRLLSAALLLALFCGGWASAEPACDLSNPFDVPLPYVNLGWWTARGVLSDLAVDLDGDGRDERLVLYFAPIPEGQAIPPLFYEPSEDDTSEEWIDYDHPLGSLALRLAVFRQDARLADIPIEPWMAMGYANIRASVWGDQQKHIYVRSGIFREIDGGADPSVRHWVLAFRGDQLTVELALLDVQSNGYEWEGLFRLPADDPEALPWLDHEAGEALVIDERERAFTDTFLPDASGFEQLEKREPEHWHADIAAALAARLAPFGIDSERDEDPQRCALVCSIRFYLDDEWLGDEAEFTSQVVDHTGLAR